jgi:hypothetical protein
MVDRAHFESAAPKPPRRTRRDRNALIVSRVMASPWENRKRRISHPPDLPLQQGIAIFADVARHG